jgi:hypothetical protein
MFCENVSEWNANQMQHVVENVKLQDRLQHLWVHMLYINCVVTT